MLTWPLPKQVGAPHPISIPSSWRARICLPCPVSSAHLSVLSTSQQSGEDVPTSSWAPRCPWTASCAQQGGGSESPGQPGLWVTHCCCPQLPPDLLRVRQEAAAAAVRSPGGLDVHLAPATAGQRRKQGLAQHREGTTLAGAPSFSERYWGAGICKGPCFLCLFLGYKAGLSRLCKSGPQPAPLHLASHLHPRTLPSATAANPGGGAGVLPPSPPSWPAVQKGPDACQQ